MYNMTQKKQKLTESEFQHKCDEYVQRNVLLCASPLAEHIINGWDSYDGDSTKPFDYDDIENLILPYEDAKLLGYVEDGQTEEEYYDNAEPQEILEWWFVDYGLYAHLKEAGEPVLSDGFYYLWGRTTSGQSISMDGCIRSLVRKLLTVEVVR